MSGNPNFLSETKSLEDLISRMVSPDRETFQTYQSMRVEAAFLNRIFVVYRPQGLQKSGEHREPEILSQVRVADFQVNARTGAEVVLEDLTTHEVMSVGYIPKRLFGYDVFLSVAPRQRLNWDASLHNGIVRRSLSFGMMIKERSRPDFYSYGCTSIETPANFRALFPKTDLTLMA